MDLEGIITLSEVVKDKYCMIWLHMEFKQKTKQKQTQRYSEQTDEVILTFRV